MSYRIEIENPNLMNAISQMEGFDGVWNAEHKAAMRQIVSAARALILPDVPVRTGKAKAAFRTSVAGSVGFGNSGDAAFGEENVSGYGQKFVVGRVGWFGENQPWYINVVEYGAAAHEIVGNPLLIFNGTFTHEVEHPGFAARGFMAGHADEVQALAENYIGQADERIAKQIADATNSGAGAVASNGGPSGA
jgi:hypothetical protein